MRKTKKVYWDCEDVKEFIGKPNEHCCPSCHGEWADGYGRPEEIEPDEGLPEGIKMAFVCCHIQNAFSVFCKANKAKEM